MPEIGEVARIVHFLKSHLVGKTIAKVVAPDDANVFGKVGCSGPAFEKALTGKKIVGAGQQGKYFWLEMEKGPHPVLHFGMTGWMHIKGMQTFYYKRSTPEPQTDWPPRFWKFTIETKATADGPAVEAAFTDARRFARIRLLDCAGADIRKTTPLVENGPDPMVDKDIVTLEWLTEIMRRKHVPVKALLLDQANISGIGNWVGDEIMYHARLHPEQYSDTFSDEQLARLHNSLMTVCGIAVGTMSDSSKFPEEWLFKHRWGKGKKDAATTLPTGEKLAFLTVGGRTSCIVPSLQKKTGAVAGDVKKSDVIDDKRKAKKAIEEEEAAEESIAKEDLSVPSGKGKSRRAAVKKEPAEKDANGSSPASKRKAASAADGAANKKSRRSLVKAEDTAEAVDNNRRRSGRLRQQAQS